MHSSESSGVRGIFFLGPRGLPQDFYPSLPIIVVPTVFPLTYFMMAGHFLCEFLLDGALIVLPAMKSHCFHSRPKSFAAVADFSRSSLALSSYLKHNSPCLFSVLALISHSRALSYLLYATVGFSLLPKEYLRYSGRVSLAAPHLRHFIASPFLHSQGCCDLIVARIRPRDSPIRSGHWLAFLRASKKFESSFFFSFREPTEALLGRPRKLGLSGVRHRQDEDC